MAVTDSSKTSPQEAGNRRERGTRFPSFDLKACVEVPRALYMKGGGQATPDQMAAHLGYKGTNNGAYLSKIGAATLFGLITKNGPIFMPTPLAHQILSPTYPYEMKKALVDAFLNVPLFKKIYDDFKGKELPPEFGMKNALRLTYGVASNRVSEAYRSLMESADAAGLFETKNGARTHLIMPLIQAVPQTAAASSSEDSKANGKGSGGGGGDDGIERGHQSSPSGSASMESVKAKYLETLIRMFEEKSKAGEMDEKLMERIERLIGASE